MEAHFFVKYEVNKSRKYQWIGLLLGLFCLLGCDTYQHENLKLGQSEMIPVEELDKYINTEVVMKRLEESGTKIQLDSLLLLTEFLYNTDEEVALLYAQEANRIAVQNNQEISETISLYYMTMLKARQQIFGEGLEEAIVDAKICESRIAKTDRLDWLIRINNLISSIYYRL